MYNRYQLSYSHNDISYLHVPGVGVRQQLHGSGGSYVQQPGGGSYVQQPGIQYQSPAVYVQQQPQQIQQIPQQIPQQQPQQVYLQPQMIQQLHQPQAYHSPPVFLRQPQQQQQQQIQQQRRPSLGGMHGRPVTIIQKEEIHEMEKLGEGAFGRVYKAMWQGRIIAEKKITGQLDSVVMGEIEILWRLRHPNVAEMLGVVDTSTSGEICIITEFYNGGSLYDVLHGQKVQLSLEEIISYATDVAKAMTYLHDYHITHRDIKSQNILLQKDGTNASAIVADFGVAKMTEQTLKLATQIGTPNWMAPEIVVLNAKKGYDSKVDVYSFAMLLYEMMTNQIPFAGMNAIQIGFCLAKGERPAKPSISSRVPKELINLMTRCWSQEPEKRPSFDEIRGELKMIHTKHFSSLIPVAKKRFSFSH